MVKIQILTRCEACDGEAYIPIGEAISTKGEPYTRYEPCAQCQGSGNQTKWVSLHEFLDLLTEEASKDPSEPDWLELSQQQPISQYQDSRDAAGI